MNQVASVSAAIEVELVPGVLSASGRIGYREFAVHYRENVEAVYAFLNYYARNHFEAEDLTADTFERALRYLPSYDPAKGPFRTWLFRIASNVAKRDRFKQRTPVQYLDQATDLSDSPGEDRWSAVDAQIELKDALASLSERDAKVVILRFGAGLSNPEIGTVLGLSDSNVSTILLRALRKMGQTLK